MKTKSAFDLSKDLPREQQLWIEGRYREFSKDWKKAAEVYRTRFTPSLPITSITDYV